MDTLKLIYKILSYLKIQESNEIFDEEHFTAEYFKVKEIEFSKAIAKLVKKGYIDGVKVESTKDGICIALLDPNITIDGLEYLEENSTMQKIYRTLKGIKETVPYI